MAHNRSDTEFMAEAHRVAQRLPRRPWPNPPVGAVVVRDGEICLLYTSDAADE